ncbi:MAG: nucleoside deaminase [Mollicutes bacterium]|nr:nucleoside deaminase [Mollicutes bacterium]
MINKVTKELLKLSKKANSLNEIPVGAIIVKKNKIISKAYNNKNKTKLCTGHAEIIAIQKASKKVKDWRLTDCELYVTLEPCNMCKEVIRQARIKRVVYFVKTNFINEEQKNIEYIYENSIFSSEFLKLIKSFFKNKR